MIDGVFFYQLTGLHGQSDQAHAFYCLPEAVFVFACCGPGLNRFVLSAVGSVLFVSACSADSSCVSLLFSDSSAGASGLSSTVVSSSIMFDSR